MKGSRASLVNHTRVLPYAHIYENASGIKNFLWEYNPGRFYTTFIYKDSAQRIRDFSVRPDDIWLISYPRTGSTWCQEMIWLIANNLDFNTAKNTLQQYRAPLIETSTALYHYFGLFKEKFTDVLEYTGSLSSPRCIKSHLRSPLLPVALYKEKPKIIYTMRNPKDVCVSYHFHAKAFHGIDIDFEMFCELFLNGALACGGIFDHYLEFWNRRHEDNILILKYEDMISDTRGALKKIADFLQKPLSEGDIIALEEFVNFKNMRGNRGCNAEPLMEFKNGLNRLESTDAHLLRNGKVGDWKNYMSAEATRKFDQYIARHTQGTDMFFD